MTKIPMQAAEYEGLRAGEVFGAQGQQDDLGRLDTAAAKIVDSLDDLPRRQQPRGWGDGNRARPFVDRAAAAETIWPEHVSGSGTCEYLLAKIAMLLEAKLTPEQRERYQALVRAPRFAVTSHVDTAPLSTSIGGPL